jgi:L-arabinose isomerase
MSKHILKKAKVGLLVTALLEDEWNKTAHIRPKAVEATGRIAGVLERFAEVVNPGFVENEEDAYRAAAVFNAEDVSLIVFVELAYQKGLVPLRTLLATHAPILVWNTQMIRDYPDDADFDLIMLNSGMAGLAEVTGALKRTGRTFSVITGHLGDERMLEVVKDHLEAAKTVHNLKNARIGVIGHPYEGMVDLMVDNLSLRDKIGPVVWPIEHEWVAEAAERIRNSEILELINEERLRYSSLEVPSPALEKSFALALALESVVKEHDLDAVAEFDQIWLKDPRVGVIPSYGSSRLTAMGIPFTCEADVGQAAAMLILQNLTGHATFLENYMMDFKEDVMMLSHDGHGNPALAAAPEEVAVKPSIYYEGVHGYGASFEYAYRPGDFTLMSLVPDGKGHWRMVIAEGESLPMKPRHIVAPQMLFRYAGGSIADYASRWVEAGPSHHMVGAYGRLAETLKRVAAMTGIEAVVV